tara:strand:- start:364 stop:1500 length:1137 start_codon:yes stop_codon:yes gene_type:complete
MKKLKSGNFFPVSKPEILKSDINFLVGAIKDGWISSEGEKVSIFEKKLSTYIGRKYGIAVSSGTAALEVAIKSLKLKKGSEVILSNFTIISPALAVVKEGLNPVFVDVDPITWNSRFEEIIKKVTKKTTCIIATHTYGYPMEIDKLEKFCRKNKIYLIEDAAEMVCHKYKKKYCGNYGDISTYSFYANKHITTGEGGMIFTNNLKLKDYCADIRNLCFGKKNRFNHYDIAGNYRMTNMQAALGLAQLSRVKKILSTKKKIGKIYYDYLKKYDDVLYIQKPVYKKFVNIYWVVGVYIKKKINIKLLRNNLFKSGIQTRDFFYPLNKQDAFKGYSFYKKKFKNSEDVSKNGFYLPSYLSMKQNDIKIICNKLLHFLNEKK